MIYINKGKAPKALENYAKKPGANFNFDGDNTDAKKAWKLCLLKEQGFLCAYTMMQIEDGFIKIKNDNDVKNSVPRVRLEHLEPQNGTSRDLSHINVIAVCHGNQSKKLELQFADVRKGEMLLDRRLFPTNPKCEGYLKYQPNGRVFSEIKKLDHQISDRIENGRKYYSILNLNEQSLQDARKAAFDGVNRFLKKRNWNTSTIQKQIKVYESKDDSGRKKPYCGFVLYFLRKKLIAKNTNT